MAIICLLYKLVVLVGDTVEISPYACYGKTPMYPVSMAGLELCDDLSRVGVIIVNVTMKAPLQHGVWIRSCSMRKYMATVTKVLTIASITY